MTSDTFVPYNNKTIQRAPQWARIPREHREAIEVVSQVLPFRTNNYVLDELIDWDDLPDDPIFRLNFPHRDMLDEADYRTIQDTIARGDRAEHQLQVRKIRERMNPHPAGQQTHNVPQLGGEEVPGIQHKYDQTVLFFPKQGQTCHAYCTFCFRWPQFIGEDEFAFASNDAATLTSYLAWHPEVTDVLITGGDPLIMRTNTLARYIEPLLAPEFDHIQNIRLGTKSVSYWPRRFVSDRDADELLRLFDRVIAAGKHLAIMGHFNHPAELRPEIARTALRRITATGANVRMQSPVLRHINDKPEAWRELWTTGVRLGLVPYYMFVERDTGARQYFEIPLVEAYDIFCAAYRSVSGLARTVRGPSMSAHPGKVAIDGVPVINGKQVFALQFLQGRQAGWARRPFYAEYDQKATWFDQLKPAFGAERFFFEDELPAPRLDRTLEVVGS